MPKTSNQSTSEAKDTSEIQLGLREQFPTCEPPDARLLKEGWKTYERNHSSEDPATLRLRATYRQLMGLHSTLANNNRSLTSKVARLEHMYETETYFTSSRAQAELRGVGGETGQYQQDLREFNQDVKQFLEQLSSDSSSLHRNTLKKNLEAEINTLSAFQSLDTSFNQAYSCFVEVYGQDVAIKHNLPNRVESLRGNSEIIQCNGDNLHEQRTQLRHRLKQTSSTHGLKHISDHIDYISHVLKYMLISEKNLLVKFKTLLNL